MSRESEQRLPRSGEATDAMLIRGCLLVALLVGVAVLPTRADLVTGSLNASLDSGSLDGVMFPVMFSYNSNDVNPVGESFAPLALFDFVLLSVPFTRNDIFQGGQAIFGTASLITSRPRSK